MPTQNELVLQCFNFENWPNKEPFAIQKIVDNSYSRYIDEFHPNETYHLIYLRSGELEITYNGIRYHAYAGDMVLLPRHTPYSVKSVKGKDVRFLNAYFCGGLVDAIIRELSLDNIVYPNQNYLNAYREMFSFCDSNVALKKKIAFCCGKITAILYNLYESKITIPEKGNYLYAGQNTADFLRAVIDNHQEKFYTNEELAKLMQFSVSGMVKKFKKAYGLTPMEYQNQTRLNTVKDKLAKSDISIKEISQLLGFCDVTYFSSYFKRYVGISPNEYRKKEKAVK